jgi:hypothetical protein
LEDDEPCTIGRLIAFLYSGNYKDDGKGGSPEAPGKSCGCSTFISSTGPLTSYKPDDPVLANSKVYIAAEKFDIASLKTLAAAKYKQATLTLWDRPTFSESVDLIYDNTVKSDRKLRDVIAQTAKTHVIPLLDKPEFVTVLEKHRDLSLDVIKTLAVHENIHLQVGETTDDGLGFSQKTKVRR